MNILRFTADGSGFTQETTGFEMAPAFSTADGYSSCDDAGQGAFNGVPVITVLPATVTTPSGMPERSSRISSKITVTPT